MDDGPTSHGATVDDLEVPEMLSYVIYFPLCKQFLPGTPTIFYLKSWEGVELCASDSSLEEPWQDLPGDS